MFCIEFYCSSVHRQDAIFGSILPRSTTEVHVTSVSVPKNSQHIFISFLSCFLSWSRYSLEFRENHFHILPNPPGWVLQRGRGAGDGGGGDVGGEEEEAGGGGHVRRHRGRGWTGRSKFFSARVASERYICFSGWSREKEKEGACDRRLNVSLIFLSSSTSDF